MFHQVSKLDSAHKARSVGNVGLIQSIKCVLPCYKKNGSFAMIIWVTVYLVMASLVEAIQINTALRISAELLHFARKDEADNFGSYGQFGNYFVPYNRSPASPNPGMIYPCSSKRSSIAAVYIVTSGCS